MIARAIDAAGPNPTRDDLARAMEGLGAIDQGSRIPGSFGPGKYTAPNALYTMIFHYPCPQETTNTSGGGLFAPTRDAARRISRRSASRTGCDGVDGIAMPFEIRLNRVESTPQARSWSAIAGDTATTCPNQRYSRRSIWLKTRYVHLHCESSNQRWHVARTGVR